MTTPSTSAELDRHEDPSADATLIDARGLLCPQPLLLVRKKTRSGREGDRYFIIADDAQADLDLEVWSYRMQHQLISKDLTDGVWRFVLELGPSNS